MRISHVRRHQTRLGGLPRTALEFPWNLSVAPADGTHMMPGLVNPKPKQTWIRARLAIAALAAASLAALISAQDHAAAASGRSQRSVEAVEAVESRLAGEPIMA